MTKVLRATWQRCRVHFMRNATAHAGKTQRRPVSVWIGAAFAEADAPAAHAEWRRVAGQFNPKVPRLAELMDATFMAWQQCHVVCTYPPLILAPWCPPCSPVRGMPNIKAIEELLIVTASPQDAGIRVALARRLPDVGIPDRCTVIPSAALRQVHLTTALKGRLFLSAMPGRYSTVAAFVAAVAAAGVSHVLSLTGEAEIAAKSPAYALALSQQNIPAAFTAFPVPDFSVPEDADAFAAWLTRAAVLLDRGEHIVVHCAAGIGRTGTAALCLLALMGIPPGSAEEAVREAGSGPETEAQRDFVRRFAATQSPGRSPAA